MSPKIFGVMFIFGVIAQSMSYPTGNDLETLTQMPCSTDDLLESSYLTGKNGVIDEKYRWMELKVYVDPSYNYEYVNRIESALENLQEALPCVPMTLLSQNDIPYGDYIYIIDNKGCWSNIGRIGGRQNISLAIPGCMSESTIMHELLHALGFHHEQSRPDRDEFVEIHYENIIPGHEHNFEKMDPDRYTTYDVSYNENSIMHYSSTGFSKNGKRTITSKRNITVGSKGYMQQTDVEKLRKMYDC